MHPEMGHLRVPRFPTDPLDHGTCPFHDDCWEGWISRPAREARWGTAKQATDLARDELELLAYYIGSGLATITYVLSPQRLVLGGGVILGGGDAEHRELVLDLVRHEFAGSLRRSAATRACSAGLLSRARSRPLTPAADPRRAHCGRARRVHRPATPWRNVSRLTVLRRR